MKSILTVISFVFLLSCSGNSVDNKNCKFLLDQSVNFDLNLNLYQELNFSGNSVYIPNEGNAGIIVARVGADFYAWDAADPNHQLNNCSVVLGSGLEGICGCDDQNKYSFVTGQALENSTLRCSLRNYRVFRNGNNLIISF